MSHRSILGVSHALRVVEIVQTLSLALESAEVCWTNASLRPIRSAEVCATSGTPRPAVSCLGREHPSAQPGHVLSRRRWRPAQLGEAPQVHQVDVTSAGYDWSRVRLQFPENGWGCDTIPNGCHHLAFAWEQVSESCLATAVGPPTRIRYVRLADLLPNSRGQAFTKYALDQRSRGGVERRTSGALRRSSWTM